MEVLEMVARGMLIIGFLLTIAFTAVAMIEINQLDSGLVVAASILAVFAASAVAVTRKKYVSYAEALSYIRNLAQEPLSTAMAAEELSRYLNRKNVQFDEKARVLLKLRIRDFERLGAGLKGTERI